MSLLLLFTSSGSVNAYTLDAGVGAYTLTGQDATTTATRTVNAASGSYDLTGQDATTTATRTVNAAAGSYAITGQSATLAIFDYKLTVTQVQLLTRIWELHGLSTPLTVGPTARTTTNISQTVTEASGTVTVATTANTGILNPDIGLMVEELAALHGITTNLVVTSSSRVAGTINQSLSTAGAVTTVTRL